MATEDSSRVSVLYIGGIGRSGSTLIERLVGQLPQACNLGETMHLWRRGVMLNQRCGCGQAFYDCPFWTAVGERAFGGWANVDPDRLAYLARAVDDVRHVPRLARSRSGRSFDQLLAEYTGYYAALYRAAAEVSGARYVVDSSKVTSLAYALTHEKKVQLRLLHLLRDPRGVAYSWTKLVRRPEIVDRVEYMPRYSAGYTAVLWNGHNLLLAALRARKVPTRTLTYERFVRDPGAELREVARFMGDPEPRLDFVSAHSDEVVLERTHSVSGNPMRFTTGSVAVRRDDGWRTQMPKRQQRLVGLVSALPGLVFGYRTWRGAGPVAVPVSQSLPEPAPEPLREPAPVTITVTDWPSVTAVVPSHARPELLRRAIRSVLAQDYPGELDVLVVHDREPEDPSLVSEFGPRVRVLSNRRTPGLCGARNTGIEAAATELIAFLDDDDAWRPGKVRAQVERLVAEPSAVLSSTAIDVEFAGTRSVRTAGRDQVSFDDLLMSRMTMLHSSSFVVRREALLGRLGLLNETIPGSMGEDWDLLLRAARIHPIAHVDRPLVDILWGSSSFFTRDWRTRLAANDWFIAAYPELSRHPAGLGRLLGQNAFFAATVGQRGRALASFRTAVRSNPREARAWLALPVVAVPRLGPVVLMLLHRKGRGI